MNSTIYLDYQSSKPIDPEVITVMMNYLSTHFGNASALHTDGDRATEALEESRKKIALFINAEQPDEIIFTPGATYSNNLAIIGCAMRNKRKGNHIIISEVEHISVHNIGKYLQRNGFEVSKVPVDIHGTIRMDKLNDLVKEDTILISIQYANNEIGTIQPVIEISETARERGVFFHSDAVAAEGLIPLDVQKDHIDMLTLSSNDIYGPRGLGVLYIRKGVHVNPLNIGGGQERGLCSGTEDVASIVGMAKAAEIAGKNLEGESARLKDLRDYLIKNVLEKIPRAFLNGHPENRLPNNAHFRFDYIEGESLLLAIKDEGISISTGSACTSKTLEPSHTLIATGLLHEEAHGSLEVTLGRYSTRDDVDRLLDVLPKVVTRLRELSPLTR